MLEISPEPQLQFLQRRHHFNQNFIMNPVNSLKVQIYLDLGIWGLKTRFEPIEPKRLTRPREHLQKNFVMLTRFWLSSMWVKAQGESNPLKNTNHLFFCQAPLKSTNCPSLPFQVIPPICWFFVNLSLKISFFSEPP